MTAACRSSRQKSSTGWPAAQDRQSAVRALQHGFRGLPLPWEQPSTPALARSLQNRPRDTPAQQARHSACWPAQQLRLPATPRRAYSSQPGTPRCSPVEQKEASETPNLHAWQGATSASQQSPSSPPGPVDRVSVSPREAPPTMKDWNCRRAASGILLESQVFAYVGHCFDSGQLITAPVVKIAMARATAAPVTMTHRRHS
mmetsp:Transcript_9816/g.28120  ORF Transcript_9816/g.28120 Transcript_9816/m.28120 type:complete len:201 (-) Transcript_9816:300-902(-)